MPPIPQIFRSSSGLPVDPPDLSFCTTMWSQSGSWRHLWCLQPKKAPKGDFWVEKVPPKFFSYIDMWNFAPFFLLAKNFSGSISSSLFSNPNAFSHAPEKKHANLGTKLLESNHIYYFATFEPLKISLFMVLVRNRRGSKYHPIGHGFGQGGWPKFFFPQSANWGGPVGHLAWESKFFTHPWAGSWVKRSPGPKSGIMGSSRKRAPHGSPDGCRNPPNAFLPWNQLCWRQPDYKNAICRKQRTTYL